MDFREKDLNKERWKERKEGNESEDDKDSIPLDSCSENKH